MRGYLIVDANFFDFSIQITFSIIYHAHLILIVKTII